MSASSTVARHTPQAIWPFVLDTAVRARGAMRRRIQSLSNRLTAHEAANGEWSWVLRRERRLTRNRELRLFAQLQDTTLSMRLTGKDPRRSPEVRRLVQELGNAAFDADLIGAWDKKQRPYVLKTVSGQPNFRLT